MSRNHCTGEDLFLNNAVKELLEEQDSLQSFQESVHSLVASRWDIEFSMIILIAPVDKESKIIRYCNRQFNVQHLTQKEVGIWVSLDDTLCSCLYTSQVMSAEQHREKNIVPAKSNAISLVRIAPARRQTADAELILFSRKSPSELLLDVYPDKNFLYAISCTYDRVLLASQLILESKLKQEYIYKLELLGKIDQELTFSQEEEDVFLILAKKVRLLVEANRVSFAVKLDKPDYAKLVKIDGDGTAKDNLIVNLKRSPMQRVFSEKKVVSIPNVENDDNVFNDDLLKIGTVCTLHLPVFINNEIYGCMNIGTKVVNSFNNQDISILSALTAFMGLTLERIRSEQNTKRHLELSELRLRSIIDGSPLLLLVIDQKGVMQTVSRYGAEQLLYDVDELTYQSVAKLFSDDYQFIYQQLMNLFDLDSEEVFIRQEVRVLRKNNSLIWAKLSARIIDFPNFERRLLLTCEDITEVKSLHQQIEYQATHDTLTGFLNRDTFDKLVTRSFVARKPGFPGALFYIDLDFFKLVNDCYGHSIGDRVLQAVAERIRTVVGEEAAIARLGGDEFAVLFETLRADEAERYAAKLVSSLSQTPLMIDHHTIQLSLSVGVSLFTSGDLSPQSLIDEADSACYASKLAGRNRYSSSGRDSTTLRKRKHESEWVEKINKALSNGGFQLYVQRIDSGAVQQTAVELLIRMKNEDSTLVDPVEFIGVAEQFGLIQHIDRRVIQLLDRELQNVPNGNWPSKVFVNISRASLNDLEFVKFVEETFKHSTLKPSILCFEITETATMSNPQYANRFITKMRGMGCCVALDDFGAGLSSLSFLRNLEIDYLKVDGALIHNLYKDPKNLIIVETIVKMAKGLGMKTVAEHVEDEKTLTILKDMGFDLFQGYIFGEPLPFSEYLK